MAISKSVVAQLVNDAVASALAQLSSEKSSPVLKSSPALEAPMGWVVVRTIQAGPLTLRVEHKAANIRSPYRIVAAGGDSGIYFKADPMR